MAPGAGRRGFEPDPLSTFLAGVFLLFLVVGFGDVVGVIPMAALVGVLIMVSVSTFDWHSVQLSTLRPMPKSETIVMVSTVAVVVLTHNLAIGVVVGVLVATVLFARRVAHLTQVEDVAELDEDTHIYAVTGELFFATSNDLHHVEIVGLQRGERPHARAAQRPPGRRSLGRPAKPAVASG